MTIILGGSKMGDFSKNNGNRKEEILAKSRNSRNDEGMENARLRGLDLGIIITTVIIGFPMFVLSIIANKMIVITTICALNGTATSVRNLIMYRFTRKKRYLFWAISLGIVGVGSFVLFILDVFGL